MKSIIQEYWYALLLILAPLLLSLVCLLLLFAYFQKDTYTNNRRLDNFHQQHLNLPDVPGSEVLYDYKKVGVLEGNSNHCDLGTVLVYKANVDYQEFKDFYKDLRINGFNEINEKFDEEASFYTVELKEGDTLDTPEDYLVDYGFVRNHLIQDEEFQKILEKEGTVYVAWVRDYNPPNNDSRCH